MSIKQSILSFALLLHIFFIIQPMNNTLHKRKLNKTFTTQQERDIAEDNLARSK